MPMPVFIHLIGNLRLKIKAKPFFGLKNRIFEHFYIVFYIVLICIVIIIFLKKLDFLFGVVYYGIVVMLLQTVYI